MTEQPGGKTQVVILLYDRQEQLLALAAAQLRQFGSIYFTIGSQVKRDAPRPGPVWQLLDKSGCGPRRCELFPRAQGLPALA